MINKQRTCDRVVHGKDKDLVDYKVNKSLLIFGVKLFKSSDVQTTIEVDSDTNRVGFSICK